jgi:hypothetical protein
MDGHLKATARTDTRYIMLADRLKRKEPAREESVAGVAKKKRA